jgi:hypothetical protein
MSSVWQTAGSGVIGAIIGTLGVSTLGCGGAEDDDVTVVAAAPGGDDPSTSTGTPGPSGPSLNGGAEPGAGAIERGPSSFPMSRVLFGDEGQTTYVNVLSSLEAAGDLERAREFAGWADLWVHAGKLFVADGEAPVMTRHAVDASGDLIEEGRVSFQNYGATSVAFWNQLFVADEKAYLFNAEAREVVVWNPSTLATVGSFPLPELADRGAQRLAGPSADRAAVVRGNRAFVAFYWASWDDYSLSDDSVILVLDTQTNAVLRTIPVACPELNFASVDGEGTIYFSNWGFSAVPTLLDGKPNACAVRIPADSEEVDPAWSLTFADLTDGREASALRWLGDGRALLTVLHDERITIAPDADRYALTDSANWKLWVVDVERRTATPLDSLGWHAPGLYGARVAGQTYLFVPTADYASTATYLFSQDGSAELRWQAPGWQTRLFELAR